MLSLVFVLATAPLQPGSNASFLGWSSDGESVAWARKVSATSPRHRYFQKSGKKAEVPMAQVMKLSDVERKAQRETVARPSGEGDVDEQVDDRATVITVHELATGAEKKFLAAYEALTVQAGGPGRKGLEALADAAAWDAWKQGAGLVSRKGLDGPRDAKARVTVGGVAAASWSPNGETVVLSVTRGADQASVSFVDEMEAMFVPQRSVAAWWDPTGRRVLFAVETAKANTMRGPVEPSSEYRVLAVPPRVEVVASARLKAEGERVAGVVEKAGFAVSAAGVAQQDRATTVIYADEKHQAEAKALAAALTGATVEKLTWKANAELVVAVGQ